MTVLSESQEERLKEITANLRRIRKENSISLEQISMQTHIRIYSLKALEEWRFEDLPEPVFVQGFIRRYADQLGLDGDAIANSFDIHSLNDTNKYQQKKVLIYIPLYIPYILLLLTASAGIFYLIKADIDSHLNNQNEQPKLNIPKNLTK